MCDTFVVVGDAALGGGVLLAKNSDRDPVEPQLVEIHPAKEYPEAARVQCTHLAIPQVRRTNRVLLSRPAWMFGAEMGANEHGLIIGNEAVFTRARVPRSGLTGMDLLRLALERTASAQEALELMVHLDAEHGQGGSASKIHPGNRYFSSFLIADATEAWVLEFSAVHQWTAARITHGVRSISNRLSLASGWDRSSEGLASRGDLVREASDRILTPFARGRERCERTASLAGARVPVSVADAFGVLRDHGAVTDAALWTPARATTACVCMHVTGVLNPGQTTSSLVAHTTKQGLEVWITGSSAPCLSVFKPVDITDALPLPTAGDYWHRHERLHRLALVGYPARCAAIRRSYDRFEAEWLAVWQGAQDRRGVSARAFAEADRLLEQLITEVQSLDASPRGGLLYRWNWRSWDRQGRAVFREQPG